MTEEQKRFKIFKKTSYEDRVREEQNKINISTFISGFNLLLIIVCIISSKETQDSFMSNFNIACTLAPALTSIHSLKIMMSAICKKTILESKIEDIEDELEEIEKLGQNVEPEEEKGMRR